MLSSNEVQVNINLNSALVLIADNDGKNLAMRTLLKKLIFLTLIFLSIIYLQMLGLSLLRPHTVVWRMLLRHLIFHLPFDCHKQVVFLLCR